MMRAFVLSVLIALTPSVSDARDIWVDGHVRKDGKRVPGHYRTAPDGRMDNNYSTEGNRNPHTGRDGYIPNHADSSSSLSSSGLGLIVGGSGYGDILADRPFVPPRPGVPSITMSHILPHDLQSCTDETNRYCVEDGETFRLNGERMRLEKAESPKPGLTFCAPEVETQLIDASRDQLVDLMKQGKVTIGFYEQSATGEALVDISLENGDSVSKRMIDGGHARPRHHPHALVWCSVKSSDERSARQNP